ncbi:glycosyltransferase [Flavobacterium sp. DSR3-2]|uniref:glycosyltransferase n=1 Tax=Flavobacterium sp. DSR3-2 TaxID=2804634 RepID=UPI003CFBACD0
MISIITPVLNGADFIENNIKSIEKLTIPFEHIIVDGGSTDGTLEIIQRFSNVKVIHQKEGRGMYHAIHLGFKESIGDIITWVNSDDIILNNGFEKLYTTIVNSKSDVVYSDAFFINISGKRIKNVKGRYFAKFLLKNGIFPFIQPSAIFTKKLYYKVGGFDFINFKIAGDLDLFYRFSLLKEVKFKKIKKYSVEFLKYGDSLGDKNTVLANKERDRANIPIPTLIIRIFNKIVSL